MPTTSVREKTTSGESYTAIKAAIGRSIRSTERDAKMAYALAIQILISVGFVFMIGASERESQLAFVGIALVVGLGWIAGFMVVVAMIGHAFPLSRASVILAVVHTLLFLFSSWVLRDIGIQRLLGH